MEQSVEQPTPGARHSEPQGDERLLAQRYLTLADSMPQLVWATDAQGSHFYFNRRWYEYTGLSEAESLGFGFTNALHPDDHERTLARWRRAWANGESYEIEYRFRRHDGVYHWFIGRAMPVYGDGGQIVEWVGTCTEIDEQKRAAESMAFLAEISTLLSSSLDYETTIRQVARLAVPEIADWCAVDLVDPRLGLRRLAVAHVDPHKVELAHEIWRRVPFDPDAPGGVAQVLRTGQPELIPAISEDLIRSSIADPELLEIFLSLGLCSSMVVPLSARGRTLGTLTLVSAESGRLFTPTDLRFAQEIARRAALAIDNAELYRELHQFRATLDQTLDCVFMFDAETLHFFYVNQGASDQVGYSRDELLQMTPLDIKPEFDAERFRAMVAPLRSGERPHHTFTTVHRHKSGRDIPVEIMLQHVTAADGSGRFVAVVRDITDRRRAEAALRASEQRHRQLADAMPLLVWIADQSGVGNYYNQRWLDYTGLSPEQITLESWSALIHPDDRAHVQERWDACVRDSAPFEVEYRFRRADGVYRWQLVRAVPVAGPDSGVAYWVGTNTDIDEQKQGEVILRERGEELSRLAATLEDRNRELDQFAYITSHDLKAPLRGIANLAQWIEEDLGDRADAQIRSFLELLRGRVMRMEKLIEGILQYSRVGRVVNTVERVDVAELLAEVVDLLAPPPEVELAVVPPLPTLQTERLALHQVFSNLIGNAVKHNAGRPLRITIGAQRRGALTEFSVADDGQGIAPQYHERIFGIFQTLASRDKVEGSGLGLALVRKIVERQGGRIRVSSAEGQGATFHFTWPDRGP